MNDDPVVADAYERAPVGLLTLAPDWRIERANHTMGTWAGCGADALLGRPFTSLLSVGSRLFHHTHWAPLIEMQGSVAELQLELLGADRKIQPVLVNAVLQADRRVDVAMFVAADRRKYERELLQARRQAEEREAAYRTLAENSPDVIVRFDQDGRLVYCNAAFSSPSRRPAEVGSTPEELDLPSGIARAWSEAVKKALRGEASTVALRDAPLGGATRDLEARAVPELDARGQVCSVLLITRDVTALRAQEREMRQRALLAEQLVGIVSHDLRNPLNAVLLGAQILRTGDPAKHAKVLARIASSAERASRLVTDLLDFTQARLGGGLPLSLAPVDLHGLVGECLDELRLTFPGRALEHRRQGKGVIVADPDRIAQVVGNLIDNAMRYGTEASPVVVTTEVGEARAGIGVHNEGREIPVDLQGRIFEPLQRGDADLRKGARSVGLGLYIVREIASAHGGKVEVRSAPGTGTTFVVELPQRPGGDGRQWPER